MHWIINVYIPKMKIYMNRSGCMIEWMTMWHHKHSDTYSWCHGMRFSFGLGDWVIDIIFQCSSNKFRIFLCTFDASMRKKYIHTHTYTNTPICTRQPILVLSISFCIAICPFLRDDFAFAHTICVSNILLVKNKAKKTCVGLNRQPSFRNFCTAPEGKNYSRLSQMRVSAFNHPSD